MYKNSKIHYLIATLLCEFLGFALWGGPSHPDHEFYPLQLIGLFLLFCFWALSIMAWGKIWIALFKLKELGIFGILSFGSLGAVGTSILLISSSVMGTQFSTLLLMLLILGPCLDLLLNYRVNLQQQLSFYKCIENIYTEFYQTPKLHLLIIAVIFFSCITRFVEASIPHNHSDALYYHLLGPYHWVQAGHLYLPQEIPIVMRGSYWESIYLWVLSLTTAEQNRGLVEGQIFAQWTSVFFGYLGSICALNSLFKFLIDSPQWRLLAVWAGMSVPVLSWLPATAKNDYGVIFWTLAGTVFFTKYSDKNRRGLFFSGIFWGLALASKLNVSFFILPAIFFFFFILKPKNRASSSALVMSIMAIVLVLYFLKNWIYTGNPFFPRVNNWFSNVWVSKTYEIQMRYYEGLSISIDFERYYKRTIEFFQSCIFSESFVIFPLLYFFKRTEKKVLWLWVSCVSGLLLFVTTVASDADVRLAGPLLTLAAALSIVVVGKYLDTLSIVQPKINSLASVVTLFVFATTYIPFHAWSYVINNTELTRVIRHTFIGGDANAWLRMNAQSSEFIVTTGYDHFYYVGSLNISAASDQPYLERLLYKARSPVEIILELQRLGAKYLYDSYHFSGVRYWTGLAERMGPYLDLHPEAIVFNGWKNRIFDVQKLAAQITQSCLSQKEAYFINLKLN